MDGYSKQQCLALCGQDDFAALKSIRRQKTIWMLAGRRMQPPTGEVFIFSFQARLPRTGVMSHEWGEGGREQCSPEHSVSLLWQVIKFEMPAKSALGTGVEKMSRNSQTLCSQVQWHHGNKYRPHWTATPPETVICVTLGLRRLLCYLLHYLFSFK